MHDNQGTTTELEFTTLRPLMSFADHKLLDAGGHDLDVARRLAGRARAKFWRGVVRSVVVTTAYVWCLLQLPRTGVPPWLAPLASTVFVLHILLMGASRILSWRLNVRARQLVQRLEARQSAEGHAALHGG